MSPRWGVNTYFGHVTLHDLQDWSFQQLFPQFDLLSSFNLTFQTPCFSAKISIIHAISQWFQWCESSFNRRRISPVIKFLLLFDHFWDCCMVTRNSLHQLLQNSSAICCTYLHCLWQHISECPNSPRAGIMTLIFIVSILEGHIGLRLLLSLNNSVVKLIPCVWTCDDKYFLLILFVATMLHPYDLQLGCFWSNQYAPFSQRKCLILVCSFLEMSFEFIICSNKSGTIITSLASKITSSGNHSSKCHCRWISFHCSHDFNVNCPVD